MKRIFSITIITIGLALGSCNKLVDEQPISSGLLSSFFHNKLDADAAVAGMYAEFQITMINNSGGQYNNRITWWGEARSDNWERRTVYALASQNEIDFNGLTSTNSYADWTLLYRTISRANLLLRNLPLIKNYTTPGTTLALTPALEASYTAQCLTMRALCYFWIARVWGDAPLRTTVYDPGDVAEQAKDPQAKLLQQCKDDLQAAYDLTIKGQTPIVFYLGEGAICAIAADVYMWDKDYVNAIKWFKLLFAAKAPTGKVYNAAGTGVTGSGGAAADLQSGPTWNVQFATPAASPESIFNIHWDATANGCACMAGISKTTNEPLIRMADPLWTAWPTKSTALYGTVTATTDVRVKQTYNTSSSTNVQVRDRSFWKFYPGTFVPATATAGYTFTSTGYGGQVANVPATDQTNVYIPLYRLSAMYLLYAEALNKSNDPTDAIKYLNLIKARAGTGPVTAAQSADQASLELAILDERQLELIGEGVRWFDLVRTDRVATTMNPILIARQLVAGNAQVGWGTDKRRYYWPIASTVLYSNNLLVQNPVYNGQ